MKKIVIVGHGGLAKEAAFLIEEINRAQPTWLLRGHISRQPDQVGQVNGKYAVCGTDDWLSTLAQPMAVALAVGQSPVLAALHTRLRQNPRLSFPNLIHPRAVGDWERVAMGEGNIVLGATSFTTDIRLGSVNVFNPGCTVAHDCVLGSYNLINPGANLSGNVTLGDRVLVGTGAQILQGLRIGDGVVIGAGAVVTKDLPESGVYVGVPARRRG